MRLLKIAATGMAAQQMRVETISNNLANMSTTGYNARRAEFADLHYQQVTRAGTISASDGSVLPTGVQLGLGVRPAAVTVELTQGSLRATGGDLDLAIDGQGYLEVTLPSGQSGYTRDGSLGQLNLVGFANAKGLEAIGSNLFLETEASGPANVTTAGQDGLGTLRHGFLEDSSVDPVREITELIEAQRGYELNAKVITAADQMLAATTQVR
jgi:flagellar basal-body rod protein FlgG